MNKEQAPTDRSLIEQFLDDNVLFLGPDPDIMRDHSVTIPTEQEAAAVAAWADRSEDINLTATACKPPVMNLSIWSNKWAQHRVPSGAI